MLHAIVVNFSAETLRNGIQIIILEVFGYPRHKSCADREPKQDGNSLQKLPESKRVKLGGIVVDHMAEYERIKQRKNLVNGRKDQNQGTQLPIILQIRIKNFHISSIK